MGGVLALCLERGSSVDAWCQAPSQWRGGHLERRLQCRELYTGGFLALGAFPVSEAWPAASDTQRPTLRVCNFSPSACRGRWHLWAPLGHPELRQRHLLAFSGFLPGEGRARFWTSQCDLEDIRSPWRPQCWKCFAEGAVRRHLNSAHVQR